MLRLVLGAVLALGLLSPVHAQDASQIHQWFQERYMQVDIDRWLKGTSRCSEADGKMREVHILADGMYATQRDDGAWLFFTADIIEPKEKCNSPFYQWVTWIIGDRVVCACAPQTGG